MKSAVGVFLFVLIFVYCTKSPTQPETIGYDNFVPLNVGNEWIGQTTAQSGQMVDTIRVVRDTTIGNVSWFLMNYWGNSDFFLRLDQNGLWGSQYGSMFLVAKYPTKAGDSWLIGDSILSEMRCIVTNIDTTISVPYGMVTCIHYSWISPSDSNSRQEWFLKPGIGFIKLSNTYYVDPTVGYRTTTWELKSYSLK